MDAKYLPLQDGPLHTYKWTLWISPQKTHGFVTGVLGPRGVSVCPFHEATWGLLQELEIVPGGLFRCPFLDLGWASHGEGRICFFCCCFFERKLVFFFSKGRSSNRATHYGVVMILWWWWWSWSWSWWWYKMTSNLIYDDFWRQNDCMYQRIVHESIPQKVIGWQCPCKNSTNKTCPGKWMWKCSFRLCVFVVYG